MNTTFKAISLFAAFFLALLLSPLITDFFIGGMGVSNQGLILTLFCLSTIGPASALLLGAGYFIYQVDERIKETAWQTLAASHQLKFIPGRYLSTHKARFTGSFRGRQLELYGETEIKLTTTNDPSLAISNSLDDSLEVEEVIKQLVASIPKTLKGYLKASPYGEQITYQQSGLEKDTEYLHTTFNLLNDLTDLYPKVVALGSEIVPTLQAMARNNSHPLQDVATQLLHDIGRETEARLHNNTAQCKRCLAYSRAYTVPLGYEGFVTYYGCQLCGQSREFFDWVIATLDNQMNTDQLPEGRKLRVNWLINRNLFNFDEIEIAQATDEDVERFAVQVGNDTDPTRKPRYKEMRCVVSASCQLSENTMRILQRTFGEVEVKNYRQPEGV